MSRIKIDYNEKLMNFLDDRYIDTGEDLDNNYIIMVEDYKIYDLIEKLHHLATNMVLKGQKINYFLEYFYKIDIYTQLHYKENYVYCGYCGQYAYHNNYGVNDNYYINDGGECTCKNCIDKDDYIEYLINNKKACNVILSNEDINELGYTILSDYNFNIDMYGGQQFNKENFEADINKLDIEYFYYLNTCHQFGTYFTICVKNDNIEKINEFLSDNYLKFKDV